MSTNYKKPKTRNFMEIHPVVLALFRAVKYREKRTDITTYAPALRTHLERLTSKLVHCRLIFAIVNRL